MKLALVIEIAEPRASADVKQKRRPALVAVGKIFKGLCKVRATKEFVNRDYDLLTVPGVEVAS
jgi:hypothetical protein